MVFIKRLVLESAGNDTNIKTNRNLPMVKIEMSNRYCQLDAFNHGEPSIDQLIRILQSIDVKMKAMAGEA